MVCWRFDRCCRSACRPDASIKVIKSALREFPAPSSPAQVIGKVPQQPEVQRSSTRGATDKAGQLEERKSGAGGTGGMQDCCRLSWERNSALIDQFLQIAERKVAVRWTTMETRAGVHWTRKSCALMKIANTEGASGFLPHSKTQGDLPDPACAQIRTPRGNRVSERACPPSLRQLWAGSGG